jgi:hypothetical protein
LASTRRQRDQLAQAIEQPRVGALASRMHRPAVDEPVADGRRARQPEPLENVEHRTEGSVVIREGAGALDRLSPSGAPPPKARTGQTNTLHGALDEELLIAGLRAKPVERELQRGGSAVQTEDGGVQRSSCRTRYQSWLMTRLLPSYPSTLKDAVSSANCQSLAGGSPSQIASGRGGAGGRSARSRVRLLPPSFLPSGGS